MATLDLTLRSTQYTVTFYTCPYDNSIKLFISVE